MSIFSELIRQESEFRSFAECLADDLVRKQPLPISVNGLSGGATEAFVIEAVREARRRTPSPVVVLTPDEQSAREVADYLSCDGLSAMRFPGRELVFHNVGASRDVERERLFVLLELASGRLDCVVCTPDAAVGYTMPKERLLSSTVSLRLGDELSPEALSEKLSSLGFAFVDSVEGKDSSRAAAVSSISSAASAKAP